MAVFMLLGELIATALLLPALLITTGWILEYASMTYVIAAAAAVALTSLFAVGSWILLWREIRGRVIDPETIVTSAGFLVGFAFGTAVLVAPAA